MKAYRKVLVYKNKVKKIVCNFCGETINTNCFGYSDEHISVEKKWGFGSQNDGETHSFEICMPCYEKLKNEMKIQPNVK